MLSGDVLQTKRSHPIRHVLRLHGFCNSAGTPIHGWLEITLHPKCFRVAVIDLVKNNSMVALISHHGKKV